MISYIRYMRFPSCNPSLFWFHFQVTKSEVCIRLPVFRDYKVAHVQDAVVRMYDYYEPSKYSFKQSLNVAVIP